MPCFLSCKSKSVLSKPLDGSRAPFFPPDDCRHGVPLRVKGPFPAGGVVSSPNFRQDVMDEFFAQHCPKPKNVSLIRWSSKVPSSSKSDLIFVTMLCHALPRLRRHHRPF